MRIDWRLIALVIVNCALLTVRLFISMFNMEQNILKNVPRETKNGDDSITDEKRPCRKCETKNGDDTIADEMRPCRKCEYAGIFNICSKCDYFVK